MKTLVTAKKAAKKAPAKHAAKHAAKQTAPHKPGKDTRRAYEHLGRIQSLSAALPEGTNQARTLATHAEQALRASQPKDAAELLRAAEHNLFGLLATQYPADMQLSPQLLEAIQDELQKLNERAEEHGACEFSPSAIQTIYRSMQRDSVAAQKSGRYRAALEYARGAEALTHAEFPLRLSSPTTRTQLR